MEILYILLVLLIVTRVCGEIAERLGQPPLVGELVAGIILGIIVGHYSNMFPVLAHLSDNDVFMAITDLGIFFLMLLAGIAMRPQEVAGAPLRAAAVAIGGSLLPLTLGIALGWWLLPESPYKIAQTLFVGVALAVTAVPVAVRILIELDQLNSRAGRMIVSAAVIDDIISLILLAILVAVIRTGEIPSIETIVLLIGKVTLFFAVAILIGRYIFPLADRLLRRLHGDEFEFSLLLIAALAYAVLAEALDMHFILGAFLAGLFFSRRIGGKAVYEDVRNKINAITTGFLAPVFFASIGIHLEINVVGIIPGILALMVVVAIFGKVLGAGLPALAIGMSGREAAAVGFGMNARGAVELIIADVALRHGLFSLPDPAPPMVAQLFSAIVVVAVLTTVLTPVVLKFVFKQIENQ